MPKRVNGMILGSLMTYDNEMLCYPFIISHVEEFQDVYVLSSSFIRREKDDFSKFVYYEIERKNVVDSLFRIARFKQYVVIFAYWKTNMKEKGSYAS